MTIYRSRSIVVTGAALVASAAFAYAIDQSSSTPSGHVVIAGESGWGPTASQTVKATMLAAEDPPSICTGSITLDPDRKANDKVFVSTAPAPVSDNPPNDLPTTTKWLTKADATGADSGIALKGFTFRAFITSWQLSSGDNLQSELNYDQAQLDRLKSWKGNTVRFQVSQYALAGHNHPEDPTWLDYYNTYKVCITNAVNMARNSGLYVILAMQREQNPSAVPGFTDPPNMPTAETKDAWHELNMIFGTDPGVLYELWNEPGLRLYTGDTLVPAATRTKYWNWWRDGGLTDDGYTAVGHQALVDYIRGTLGSHKVLIAEGLELGKSFETLPAAKMLTDSENRIAYAVHPYPKGHSESGWPDQFAYYTNRFGFMQNRGVPVMTTEWMAPSGPDTNGLGLNGMPDWRVARDLINYSLERRMPLVASAFDVDGTMRQDVPLADTDPDTTMNKPTNYDGYAADPTKRGKNVGMLVCRFFGHGYLWKGDGTRTPYKMKHGESPYDAGTDVRDDLTPQCFAPY